MSLPLDYYTPDWRKYAACKGQHPSVFFFEDTTPDHTARRLCLTCPVRLDCIEYATEHEKDWGVWAGMTARVRLMIRRLMAKTRAKTVQQLLVNVPRSVLSEYPAPKRKYRRVTAKQPPVSTHDMFKSLIEAANIRDKAEKAREKERQSNT